MRRNPTKPVTLLLATMAVIALGACGNKTASIHHAETEGIYLTVGPLTYQVQISRQLNPVAIPEDRTFVEAIDPAEATLAPDELWFAVFVRVENGTDSPHAPASSFTISDTDGTVYRPVKLGAQNPFAFRTDPIRAGGVAPDPDSVAAQLGSINGMELLFKLKHATLDNRPLVLTIKSFFPDDEATDVLDV